MRNACGVWVYVHLSRVSCSPSKINLQAMQYQQHKHTRVWHHAGILLRLKTSDNLYGIQQKAKIETP